MPQYQGVWTLEQQAQAQSNQQWVTDPNFKNTTLLLQADGTGSGSQNQTFLDGSTNNFFITRNGNTTQGSFSPFGSSWSNYYDGSGDYLSMPSATTALALGSGDWTVECFVNLANYSDNRTLIDIFDGDSSVRFIWRILTTGLLAFQGASGATRTSTTTTVPTNQWVHLAICKASGTTRIFINGIQSNTNYTDTNTYTNSGASAIGIIASDLSSSPFLGYISNFRVVKGTALYAANFNPPTATLTAVTNTSLLTCQSNRFIDNSTSALTLTLGGNTSVQAFGPFAPALQWTPDVVGGSAFFDGVGDYLSWSGTAAGAGAFSYEFWLYSIVDFSSNRAPLGVLAISGYNSALDVRMSGTTINMSAYNVANNNFTVPALVPNTWYHVVLCRNSSNQATVFLNGVRSSTGAVTITQNFAGLTTVIGAQDAVSSPGERTTGYLSSIRLIVGSTPYDPTQTTITVPTAPLTAITNTSLLTNYTNAGIYDGKMANNLETVGNAQVATSPVKYGSGSMYFPATNGNYCVAPASPVLAFGTGDFTAEAWVYPIAFTNNPSGLFFRGINGTNNTTQWGIELNSSGTASFIWNDLNRLSSNRTLPLSVWTHIAIVRSNGVLTMYFNGVSVGTYSATNDNITVGTSTTLFWVGTNNQVPGSRQFIGYIDDLRITNGVCRYFTTFTPPQQALPRQ